MKSNYCKSQRRQSVQRFRSFLHNHKLGSELRKNPTDGSRWIVPILSITNVQMELCALANELERYNSTLFASAQNFLGQLVIERT